MIIKLLTEHHLEFLSLKRGCRGTSKSTHVKMPHCWKSHATAQKLPAAISCDLYIFINTRPISAVGNYGCVSDCRSRDSELDPGTVRYFCED